MKMAFGCVWVVKLYEPLRLKHKFVNILRKPGDVDVEDNSIDIEKVKVAGESSRTLFFC
jgi:hypothetical protein